MANERIIGDGVWLGGLTLLLAIVGLTILVVSGWRSAAEGPATTGLSIMCGAPLLAVANLFFVLRDKDRGNTRQALIGLLLSGATLFLSVIPWMGVD